MLTGVTTHYFLGANTYKGFYSLYDDLVDKDNDSRLFILKGGPGCGKSSFMKRIAAAVQERGKPVEMIHCSGDPDSLDAIYIPHLKTAYVDGTAPHVIEPDYPAAMEQYINLGSFYDSDALLPEKAKIAKTKAAYQLQYNKAYDYLAAAKNIRDAVSVDIYLAKKLAIVKRRAKGIARRELKRTQHPSGSETRRFLSAISCTGIVQDMSAADALCTRKFLIDNDYGLAPFLLEEIAKTALQNGYNIISCFDPLCPELYEHIIIPELSLGFLSSYGKKTPDSKLVKRIRLDALAMSDLGAKAKKSIRNQLKLYKAVLGESEAALESAKKIHDELEAIYNPHVDFDSLYELANEHAASI